MTTPKICGFMSSISHSIDDDALRPPLASAAARPTSTRSTFGVDRIVAIAGAVADVLDRIAGSGPNAGA